MRMDFEVRKERRDGDRVKIVVTGSYGSGKKALLENLLRRDAVKLPYLLMDTPLRIVNGAYTGRFCLEGGTADGPVQEELSEEEYREKYLSGNYPDMAAGSQNRSMPVWRRVTVRCSLRNPAYEFTELPSGETTEYWDVLTEAGAVVYCVDIRRPLTKDDMDFLKTYHSYFSGEKLQNVFLAFTHWNVIRPEAQESCKEHVRERLKRFFLNQDGSFDESLYQTRVAFVDSCKYRCDDQGGRTAGQEFAGIPELEKMLYEFLDKILADDFQQPVQRYIHRLSAVIDGLPNQKRKAAFGARLRSIQQRLSDPELKLAIIGNFSSGKSTFLNTVFGRKLLAVSDLPTTAIPTYIRWRKEEEDGNGDPSIVIETPEKYRFVLAGHEQAEFERATGRKLPQEIGEQIDYLTTTNALADRIKKIEIIFPIREEYRGFCLIDTPGVNPGDTASKKHILQTQSVLREEADAAILLYPAKDAMSKDMERFMEENAPHLMNDAIILLTKMDIIPTRREREKVLSRTRKLVAQRFGQQEPLVCGISAGEALEYVCGDSAAEQSKEWYDGFTRDMESVFHSLSARRSVLVEKQIARLLEELAGSLKEQVSTDTHRLLEEEEILRKYSLESLRKAFVQLADYFGDAVDREYRRCLKETEQLIIAYAGEGEREIMRGIESQTSILRLNAYTKNECPKIMRQVAREIADGIDSRINSRFQMLAESYVREADRYLTEFQKKIGEITVDAELLSQKTSFENIEVPVFNLLSNEDLSENSALFLLGMLISMATWGGITATSVLLSMKQKTAQQKLHEAMADFTAKLRKECAGKLGEIRTDLGKWAQELLGSYENRYRDYFAAAEQKQKERAQAVRQEIQANLSCLRELEQTEGVL